jgi:hypothetical protein
LDDSTIYSSDLEKADAIITYIMKYCTFVDCNVEQQFEEEKFVGKVVGFNGSNYTAVYDDGEISHLNTEEVKQFIYNYN